MAPGRSQRLDAPFAHCTPAASGITGVGAGLPARSPTIEDMTAHAGTINDMRNQIAAADAQLKTLRQSLRDAVSSARDDMAKVDQATDLMYGPGGAEKTNFGLDPKKTAGSSTGTPEQVVIRQTGDGTQPASIAVDFDTVEGAVYEVQWFTDSAMTQSVGSVTVTESEVEIPGLQAGQQYWIRVRAVRAGQYGPWSDPATRVANI